jgi:hypothetical protein
MTLQVSGLAALMRLLSGMGKDAEKAAEDALTELGFRVLKEAKERTPVDTGFLRSSGEVEVAEDKNSVIVKFKAEYALPVHERTEIEHANGEAKFLENAFNLVMSKQQAEQAILSRLMDAIT